MLFKNIAKLCKKQKWETPLYQGWTVLLATNQLISKLNRFSFVFHCTTWLSQDIIIRGISESRCPYFLYYLLEFLWWWLQDSYQWPNIAFLLVQTADSSADMFPVWWDWGNCTCLGHGTVSLKVAWQRILDLFPGLINIHATVTLPGMYCGFVVCILRSESHWLFYMLMELYYFIWASIGESSKPRD